MTKVELRDKTCIPCQGGTPPLESRQIQDLLMELGNGWVINDSGHLYKRYEFKDFKEPMNLANKIASLADLESHHPELKIAWGECVVEIWTHKINGLTESDFILADKIEALR